MSEDAPVDPGEVDPGEAGLNQSPADQSTSARPAGEATEGSPSDSPPRGEAGSMPPMGGVPPWGHDPATGGLGPGEKSLDENSDPLATLRARVEALEHDLARERDQATDYMNRWQRAQADLSNVRRRAEQERDQLHALAAMQAVAFALPALDSLERAFQALPETLRGLTWIDGVALVDMQLRRAVEAQGVVPIEAEPGQPVDHTRHQPIAEHETDAHPEGSVAAVIQRGYEMNGHILRPALVAVARPPRANASTSAEPPPTTNTVHDTSPAGDAPPGSSP